MKKILLDTDIGSDIDDAVCLAYLLSQPECELMGITTVSGEPGKRAMMASAVCHAAGKGHIPIYPGAEAPLFTAQRQPHAQQAARLAGHKHKTDFPQGEAIEFMRSAIRKHPGEITLLAIGPMTNVALLFSVDPEIPLMLKELVLMCGVFTYGKLPEYTCLTEWNALCDPYAAAVVYNAPVGRIKSIGLDVTTKVKMNKNEVHERFTAPVLKPVLDFSEVWFSGDSGVITFHDPLAAAVIFNEDICKFEEGGVEVETQSPRLSGLTYWKPEKGGKNQVALGVDTKLFFDHYFSIVNQPNCIKVAK